MLGGGRNSRLIASRTLKRPLSPWHEESGLGIPIMCLVERSRCLAIVEMIGKAKSQLVWALNCSTVLRLWFSNHPRPKSTESTITPVHRLRCGNRLIMGTSNSRDGKRGSPLVHFLLSLLTRSRDTVNGRLFIDLAAGPRVLFTSMVI